MRKSVPQERGSAGGKALGHHSVTSLPSKLCSEHWGQGGGQGCPCPLPILTPGCLAELEVGGTELDGLRTQEGALT